MHFIINATLITALWIIPLLVGGTLLNRAIPDVKEDETKTYTTLMIILQIVASFLMLEGFERLIRIVNKKYIKGIQMSEIMSGAFLLGVVQTTTQRKMLKRMVSFEKNVQL